MLIIHANALTEGRFQPDTTLLIRDGRVEAVGCSAPYPDEEILDLEGDYLLPGFVDVHIHAFMGMDMMQGEEAVRHMSRKLKMHGVAAFLPTTMSLDPESTKQALAGVRAVMERPEKDGAKVLGAHMEAPFLNPERAGAQRAEFFCLPTMENWQLYTGPHASAVKLVTLAPELPGAEEMIAFLTKQGIAVSAGHTSAKAEQLHQAADCGLNHITHLFNAQTPLNHRAPGVPGAALTDERIFCEMIADGIHLHPDILRLVWRCKGREKTVVVTDAMEAAGMPEGEYQLGGQAVYVKNGAARLTDGTLAGSTLTLARAVSNLISMGIPPEDAACMVSKTPAQSLGLEEYGEIRPGAPAVFARFDKNWDFVETMG